MQAGPSLNASLDWTFFIITSTIILAAGSMFILWLGERITDKGIGNGISFIILIGIIARLPQSLFQEFVSRLASPGAGGIIMFLLEIVFLLFVIAAAILLVQGVRKDSCTVCETYCRKQTIWWCKTIYSFKGECCECNAYHLCPGNHVYPYYIGRFLKCCNMQVVLYVHL